MGKRAEVVTVSGKTYKINDMSREQISKLREEILKIDRRKRKAVGREKRNRIVEKIKTGIENKMIGIGARIQEGSNEYHEVKGIKEQICEDTSDFIDCLNEQCDVLLKEKDEVISELLNERDNYTYMKTANTIMIEITEEIRELSGMLHSDMSEEEKYQIYLEIDELKNEKYQIMMESKKQPDYECEEYSPKDQEMVDYINGLLMQVRQERKSIWRSYEKQKDVLIDKEEILLAKIDNKISPLKKIFNKVSARLVSSKTWSTRVKTEILTPMKEQLNQKFEDITQNMSGGIDEVGNNFNDKMGSFRENIRLGTQNNRTVNNFEKSYGADMDKLIPNLER